VELPLRILFDAPTLAALAERVDAAQREGARDPVPPLEPLPRPERIPLSHAQQRLWFMSQLDAQGTAYNMTVAVRSDGPLGVQRLRGPLAAPVQRHGAMRAPFEPGAGEPIQRIARAARLAAEVVDCTSDAAGDATSAIAALTARTASRPLDLQHGPLA